MFIGQDDEFMNNVRTGAQVSNDEILGFAKLFNDELTLNNINRSSKHVQIYGYKPIWNKCIFTLYASEKTEAVQATLSSLPDEVVDTVQVTTLPYEDSLSKKKRKLKFLEMQEELIKEEEEEEEEEQAKMKELGSQKDVALEEMTNPTVKEAHEQAKEKILEKYEQLCELSRALAVLAFASSVSRKHEEFPRLVKKEIELYNSMVDREGTEGEEETKKANRAAREETDNDAEKDVDDKVSLALIDRVDAMLQKLEKEIDEIDAKIRDRWRLLDRDYDDKMTPEEVAYCHGLKVYAVNPCST
ncbi:hypothetical protein Q3G72_021779 [Acer saccharum]|nr:hypothetical protein Q3G72_021779 [Acer saccharum]